MLTDQEIRTLQDAWNRGFFIRSGQRIEVLVKWWELCHERQRPCIVAIKGARKATIQVQGVSEAKVPLKDLENAATLAVRKYIGYPAPCRIPIPQCA